MKKNNEPEEDEGGGYNWMDTYGDLVTLLLCFFVLLYSFSSINEEKWEEIVDAFSGTYGAAAVQAFDITSVREQPIKIDSMVNIENRLSENDQSISTDELNALKQLQEQVDMSFDELYLKIVAYIQTNRLEGQLSVLRTDDVIILRFSEVALFDSGKATIRQESEETLTHIITIISDNVGSINMVNIEGHTDNVPISNAEFSDNWDLSVKRATNTLRILLTTNLIEETKLSAIGYGEYQPITTNDTAEGRALNRRVDFVLNKIDVSAVTD